MKLIPSSHFWINEEDPKVAKLYPNLDGKGGKICPNAEWKDGQWMMFFDNSVIGEL